MVLYVTTSSGAQHAVFPSSTALSNLDRNYCSYYTPGSGFSTADIFLTNINFSNTYANVQTGIGNLQEIIAQSNSFTIPSDTSNYISTLNSQIQRLVFVSNCITEQTDSTDALFAAKKELALSKERYDILHSPETHVSYYEGTFPIYRPIGQSTLFILFGLGLFLMLLSLVLFLRTQGIELQLVLPQTLVLPGISGIFSGQWTYMGIAAGVGIALGYVFHIYYT